MKNLILLALFLTVVSVSGCANLTQLSKNKIHCVEKMLAQGLDSYASVKSCEYILKKSK